MYILPYFLENEAKNLLKIKLSKIIIDITDEFIENLFIVNPDNKYQNMMLNLEDKVKDALEEVKETIRRTLLQQKQNDVYTKTVEELKAKYIEK